MHNKGQPTMNYWLIKSEPSCFSFDDMKTKKTASWDGVRNYTARNFMREMRRGDLCLFYHSYVLQHIRMKREVKGSQLKNTIMNLCD